jgi:hypothetical protein
MATLPNVANVLRFDHRYTLHNNTNVNTALYFRYTGGPPTTSNLNTLAGSAHTAYVSNLKPQQANSVTLNQLSVQDLGDMAAALGIWTGAEAGSLAGSGAPPASVAILASYHTARRYRGGHGRGYWPLGIIGDISDAGDWSVTRQGGVSSGLTAYVAAISGLTAGVTVGAQCMISYYHGVTYTTRPGRLKPVGTPTLRATPIVDDVTGITVTARIASQRRRLKRA